MKGLPRVLSVILAIVIVGLLLLLTVGWVRPGVTLMLGPFAAPAVEEATWMKLLTLLVPLVAAVLQQTGFSKRMNSLIALGVTLLVAVADTIYFKTFDPNNLVQTVFETITAAFIAYKMLWQPLGFYDWLQTKTSIKKPRAF